MSWRQERGTSVLTSGGAQHLGPLAQHGDEAPSVVVIGLKRRRLRIEDRQPLRLSPSAFWMPCTDTTALGRKGGEVGGQLGLGLRQDSHFSNNKV